MLVRRQRKPSGTRRAFVLGLGDFTRVGDRLSAVACTPMQFVAQRLRGHCPPMFKGAIVEDLKIGQVSAFVGRVPLCVVLDQHMPDMGIKVYPGAVVSISLTVPELRLVTEGEWARFVTEGEWTTRAPLALALVGMTL